MPPAITLVRWVNENAFVSEVQTRPCPTFGRPVHLGFPHRLRPGTSPHALRIPPHDGHPALRSTTSGGSRLVLAVSSFRLRARLDVSIPSTFSGQRGFEPRFWIWRPSSERQRDFNPREQRAAQRALPDADRLPGEDLAEINLFATKADAAAMRNDNGSVVEWVVDVRQSLVRTRRSLIDIRRTLHGESFVRSFVVEDIVEFAEARLLLKEIRGSWFKRLG